MKFPPLPSFGDLCTCGMIFGLVGSASVLHADVVFEQDFESSNTVSDYVTGGGASGSLFTDISGPSSMSRSITDSALVFSNGTGTNNDTQGFRYTGGFAGGTPGFLTVDYDFDLSTTSNSSGQTIFVFGNNDEVSRPYGQSSISTTNSFAYVAVKGNGSGGLQITANTTWGGAAPSTVVPEGTLSFRLYLNDTASNYDYVGLDGNNYTSNSNTISIWYENGGTWNDYILNEAANSGDLSGFRFLHHWSGDSVTIDNLLVQTVTVPEPSQAALLMGGLLLGLTLLRRRR